MSVVADKQETKFVLTGRIQNGIWSGSEKIEMIE